MFEVKNNTVYDKYTLREMLRRYCSSNSTDYDADDDVTKYVENALNSYYQQGLVMGKLEEAIRMHSDLKEKIKVLKQEADK